MASTRRGKNSFISRSTDFCTTGDMSGHACSSFTLISGHVRGSRMLSISLTNLKIDPFTVRLSFSPNRLAAVTLMLRDAVRRVCRSVVAVYTKYVVVRLFE